MRRHGLVIALLWVVLCSVGALGCLSGTAYGAGEAVAASTSAPPEMNADPATQLQEAMRLETGGDAAPALDIYRQIIQDSDKVRPFAAKAELHTAMILERQGKNDDAVAAYKAVVDRYADMPEASDARARLQALGAGEATEEKGLKALQEKLDKRLDRVDLVDATLQDVVDYLKKAAGVNVVLGARVAEGAAQSIKTSLSLTDVTVSEFVNLAVQSFDLDWTIWSGAVYIAEPGDVNQVRLKQQQSETAFSQRIADLQAQNAELRKQLQGPNASNAKPAETNRGLGQPGAAERGNVEVARGERGEAIRKRTEAAQREEATRKRAGAAQSAALKRRTGSSPAAQPAAPEAPKPQDEATLYSVTLREFIGPQVLDLDARTALAIAPAGDVLEFFQKHPESDLAYLGAGSFVVNKGVLSAIAPADSAPEQLPQPIQYPNPRDAKGVVASITSRTMTYEPGVYADDTAGYNVIVTQGQGAFVLKTDRGEYLVRMTGQWDDGVSVSYQTLQPAAPPGLGIITSSGGSGVRFVPMEPAQPEAENKDTGAVKRTK